MKYPSVYYVGQYVDKEEFFRQRLNAAGWVHNPGLVKKVLTGTYYSIKPLHIELCTTYSCNFNCPWCSCRKSRESFLPSKKSMTLSELKVVIDECKSINCGIQWTGGEPLCNPETVNAIVYGSNVHISQCLFTNGSLLDRQVSLALLNTNLSFIRISLNAVSSNVHQAFHGGIDKRLSTAVTENIVNLCQEKKRINSDVQIGLSLVLDTGNIGDAWRTVDYIISTNMRFPGAINYVVIRPVNNDISFSSTQLGPSFWIQYSQLVSGESIKKLRDSGISVVLPSSLEIPLIDNGKCFGCSCFSEVAPDGTMFLCSDKYGDKEYSIGNVLTQGMNAWNLHERFTCIKNHRDCFAKGNCPHYSRGWYFNALFAQIEVLRMSEQMDVVKEWIDDLKQMIPNVGHSFFI